MPTEREYDDAQVGFSNAADELRGLLDGSRTILETEPVVGGWLGGYVGRRTESLHRMSQSLAAQCETASEAARGRAAKIRVWRAEELAFRSAYAAWRRTCHEIEVQAALAAVESGVPVDPDYPPEPGGRPNPAPWADLELPAFG